MLLGGKEWVIVVSQNLCHGLATIYTHIEIESIVRGCSV